MLLPCIELARTGPEDLRSVPDAIGTLDSTLLIEFSTETVRSREIAGASQEAASCEPDESRRKAPCTSVQLPLKDRDFGWKANIMRD